LLSQILHYEPPSSTLWQGRKDSLPGERFFQNIQCMDIRTESLSPNKTPLVMLGFSSDEGIRRNEGRIGARLGPNLIRQQFAKLACRKPVPIIDVGNIVCDGEQLEAAQEEFSKLIAHCHQQGARTIAFGGGHEIAWAHFRGLAAQYPKIGIINFDAHFDLRVPTDEIGTSGTPFWQIHQYCQQNGLPFNYCCLGIQPAGNAQNLWDRASEWDVSYLTAEQMHQQNFSWQTCFLDDFILQQDYLYLSLCLDVFAECYAPGVSAPQALGLAPWQAIPLLKYIVQTGKVVSFDIAELSPPLDLEQKTSRLAAATLAELLNLNYGFRED
jgi:formiminoglutamase